MLVLRGLLGWIDGWMEVNVEGHGRRALAV